MYSLTSERPRPSPIKVMDLDTFKRLFDDITPAPSPVESQGSLILPTDITIPIPNMGRFSCPGRTTHRPSTRASSIERPGNRIRSEENEVGDDTIDLYASTSLDDDSDDWDITPPATPRWYGFGGHVRVASGSGSGGQHHPFPEYHSHHHQPSFYLQRKPFHLHFHKLPFESQNSSNTSLGRTLSNPECGMLSRARSRFSTSLSTDFGRQKAETEVKIECIARPIEYSKLGPPEFTNPFAKNKPLELLPKLKESDYRPLAKKFLRNSAHMGREDREEGEVVSATLLCIPRRTVTAEKPLVCIPPSPNVQRKMEFSPRDRRGMTSKKRRMLRLMRELFPDIAAASTEDRGKLSFFVNSGESEPSKDESGYERVIYGEAVGARGAEEVWDEIVL